MIKAGIIVTSVLESIHTFRAYMESEKSISDIFPKVGKWDMLKYLPIVNFNPDIHDKCIPQK